ncbi:RagB/SusD family nutrient uptake outer membrane protein [Sinomicrobium sp. FJxs]|uniref:RagB/SusD family nutrient uptake outer membrane protein n=2 Tax=Sinomicrobium weinanense TaxID=2842200 RepID=A0A926JQ36_9FLAO|nr:RagB/SusD family nutrient uptake outer membrane protein [Sinomicrobium weinanense]MBU3122912.1 RagB/SusD family nutrient uptake outer membrane protein [Sinomicrobium weinanense]
MVSITVFLTTISCEDFVDINTPNFQIVSENVFANDETAIAAVTGIYNQLMKAQFSNGWQNSVTVLGGMSADIIEPIRSTHTTLGPFWQNEISTIDSPDAGANLSLWSSAYNIIYLANSVLEGLSGSTGVTDSIKNQLMGQALFIRAFCYFYLTNLYKDAPLLLTTDYSNNALASRNSSEEIWEQIATDLDEAIVLLDNVKDYEEGERTHINLYVVLALRARVYLYRGNWSKAEELSSRVIAQTGTYEILEDLNRVFFANNKEAIWQISPEGEKAQRVTNEAMAFIRFPFIPGIIILGDIKLADSFINTIDAEDKRFTDWIGQELDRNGEVANYYANKYKYRVPSGLDIPEYSMVLRLAEQYLIRAEARARQNKFSEAIADIDKLRQRAGIALLSDIDPGIGQEALLKVIMEERKKELFAEWGHRWLDLKRTEKASEVLSSIKPLWQRTDTWFPIPEEERIKNPNLTQNEGY